MPINRLPSASREDAWTPVCAFIGLPVEGGVTALVRGAEVAVFRTFDDQVYAVSGHDPFSRSGHLARGIVGMRGEVPFVASPVHRHAFDLRTGRCLDDPAVRVATYPVRVVDGIVHVGPRIPSQPKADHGPEAAPDDVG